MKKHLYSKILLILRMQGYSLIVVVVFAGIFCNSPLLAQEDFVSIESKKTIKIDKRKGTAFLEGDVLVTQDSTKSNLKSDTLFIERDTQTNKTILAKAEGNVRGIVNSVNESTGLKRTIKIECNLAELDRTLNRAILRGSVFVKSHDIELTADLILYDLKRESGRITEVPGKQVVIKIIKNAPSDISLLRNPKFVAQIIDGAADEIRLNKALKKITLQGNIRFYDHTEKAQFVGNRADIYFDEFEKLNKIIAYQNVVISQPQRISKADRAVFDYKTNSIVLTGNASVKEVNQMEINSPSITMHMNENKGIISGGRKIPVKAKVQISP